MSTSSYGSIVVTTNEGIDDVVLDRPARLNAFDDAMIDELYDYFAVATRATSARVIVLRGAGKGFCSGMDLTASAARSRDLDPAERLRQTGIRQQKLGDIVLSMRRCPQPIVALVHGAAAGGGFALALAADLRLAAVGARFLPSFVHIGLSGGEIGTSYLLPRIVGNAVAGEILLAGRTVTAERALQIGLVSQVVPEGELGEAGLTLANDMLRVSPLGLRMTKECLNASAGAGSLDAAIAFENRGQLLCGQTADVKEGIAAFLEKRAPRYQGR